MAIVRVCEYMVIDPEIMHGRLTFQGTRVPVSTILAFLAQGWSTDEIVKDWPQIRPEAVREAILLASDALHAQHQAELKAAACEARRQRGGDSDPAAVV